MNVRNTNNKLFKIAVIAVIFALCMPLLTAFRCEPTYFAENLYFDNNCYKIYSEDGTAKFYRGTSYGGAYGFIVLNGERTEAMLREDGLYSSDGGKLYSFSQDISVDESGKTTALLNGVKAVKEGLPALGNLVFTAAVIDKNVVPYPFLISGEYRDENGVFTFTVSDYADARAEALIYTVNEKGGIICRDYRMIWRENTLEIFNDGQLCAVCAYAFSHTEGKLVLTFQSDNLFGGAKPFAGYPNLVLNRIKSAENAL